MQATIASIIPYPFQPSNIAISKYTGISFIIQNLDPTYNITLNISNGYTPDFISSTYIIYPGTFARFEISFVNSSTIYVFIIGKT